MGNNVELLLEEQLLRWSLKWHWWKGVDRAVRSQARGVSRLCGVRHFYLLNLGEPVDYKASNRDPGGKKQTNKLFLSSSLSSCISSGEGNQSLSCASKHSARASALTLLLHYGRASGQCRQREAGQASWELRPLLLRLL